MIEDTKIRRRRKEERPSEILQAALEVFSANGFAATRLDDVAARAGITKGTIYLYFDGKEDLFVATLKEKTRPVFENLTGLVEDMQGSAVELLRRHLAFAADLMLEDRAGRDIIRILIAEGHRFPNAVDGWYEEVLGPALAAIAEILRYGIARGEFRDSAVAAFPQLVMAPIITCNSWQGIFGDRRPIDIRRFFDAAFDMISRGLLKEAS